MRSESKRRPSGPTVLAVAVAVLSCCTSDAHVGCAPTPTCSLRDARFEPAPNSDAGPVQCRLADHCPAAQIAAGAAHSCARTQAGEVVCWGSNAEQQRGDQAQAKPDTGSGASGGHGASDVQFVLVREHALQVAAGGAHTCALDDDGSVWCWGRDAEGQVDGVATDAPIGDPVAVPVAAATQIAAGGAHSCAVVTGGVVCWGSARYGQVGREVSDAALPPELVPGTQGAVEVACGVRHTCARLLFGPVKCWGELIDADSGTPHAAAEPTQVPGLSDAVHISAGAGHTCAVREGGGVVCWGENASGQLGSGNTDPSATPVTVKGLPQALRIAAGGALRDGTLLGHTCAVDTSFSVYCWGRNREGQLGIGSAPDSSRPAVVLGPSGESDEPYLPDIVEIAAGGLHTCALDHDGSVLCWGADDEDQLGRTMGDVVFGRAEHARRFGDH